MNSLQLNPKLRKIAVFGGGRWARILIETISNVTSKNTTIYIFTKNNIETMSAWLKKKNFKQKFCIYKDYDKLNTLSLNASIIVNAARYHEATIKKNIMAGIPVLVEKPVTLSFSSTQKLVSLAAKKNTLFASAHIFLYNSYINYFSEIIKNSPKISSIIVNWSDPKSESRYGEKKHYDQSITVFQDCLPHILSIINKFTAYQFIKVNNVNILKGGSCVEINSTLDDVFLSVMLERNGKNRRREFEVVTNKKLKLDFTKEPGIIYEGNKKINTVEDWSIKKTPTSQMMLAFFNQIIFGKIDERLNIDIALNANKFMDSVSDHYDKAIYSWLKTRLRSKLLIDIDLIYALKEIISFKGHFHQNEDYCVEKIMKAFTEKDATRWQDKFAKSSKPFDVIRSII